MIKFRCSHCQQKLGVPDEYAGRRVRCSKCNQPSIVPKAVVTHILSAEIASSNAVSSSKPASVGRTAAPDVSSSDVFPKVPERPAANVESSSPGSCATVNRQAEPGGLDEIELIEDDTVQDDEAARMEAIRLASKNRTRATKKTLRDKITRPSESKSSNHQKTDRLPMLDMIPDVLRLPLSIVLGFAASALVVLSWMICSRVTENALCFMAMFVPIAVAGVLRVIVVERGFLIGLLCIVIGALSIAGGKAAIAQYVVIPFFQKTANEEFLTDLKPIMNDPKLQYPASESIKSFANDGDFMTCAALVSLVEEGQADPIKTRSWAVHILLHSNKLSLLDFFDSATGGGNPVAPKPIPDLTIEEEAVLEQASMRQVQWYDEKTDKQMARKYYPAVSKLSQQAKILDVFKDKKLTYQLAFMNTLGLFDMVWILMGLGLGYATAVFD